MADKNKLKAQRLDERNQRLARAWDRRHDRAAVRVAGAARALHAMSPLATLARGYAIVTGSDGAAVVDARTLAPGQILATRFARGAAHVTVNSVEPGDDA